MTSLVAQMVKCLAYNEGDLGSIPRSGRSSGEGNDNPLPYSCLEKSHGWRSLVGYSPRGRKESDTTERLHFMNQQEESCFQPLPQSELKVKNLTKWGPSTR